MTKSNQYTPTSLSSKRCHRLTLLTLLSQILLLLLLLPPIQAGINRNAPHGHKGKLPPYTAGPFDLKLSSSDESLLAKGKPVMKQIPYAPEENREGGRVICVQEVDAPKSAVWNQILDMDRYVGKVAKLKECKNYFVRARDDGTVQVKTKMVIGVMPGYKYENYYDHHYTPSANSLTWELDYEKTSDFDDVSGHWHVEDHPSKPNSTRVFYACDVAFKTSLPGPVMNFVSKSALKQATAWVKRESEGNTNALIPEEFRTRGGEL